jgi:hypothetical protein
LELEIVKGASVSVCLQYDVPTTTAIGAVWATVGNVLFAVEAHSPGSAFTGGKFDHRLI